MFQRRFSRTNLVTFHRNTSPTRANDPISRHRPVPAPCERVSRAWHRNAGGGGITVRLQSNSRIQTNFPPSRWSGAPQDTFNITDPDKLETCPIKQKIDAEELRQRVRELEERERREGKKMADEEALRKIRSVEEQIDILNKKLSLAKQEEDALLSEMDVTGQAFEDMQEQNIRLMQQLREKDDANFKLMSERIKSNQIHKLLKEEKEELADQLLTLKTQVDAQLQVVRKLEEKERLLQGTISAAERELGLRTQALEMNKRKAQESVLLSEEVRTQLEGVQQRLSAVREEVVENSISREKESFNARRAQEDISKLRRKIEKAKKPAENIRNGDEILNEEINDYKARLTCPCCNSRVKDAVLTKCFHVFCFECVKTRYDTRQRKCPKCNAAFGANDFHRIYIG
ncbi:hypothetical protein QQF64_006743 [Cirrhinus molitorella]|uniref:E3 ubiquitin protein ligase n=1 Tax=Cirrhinus molitorella TaxID=172907 RepID=A0ABR3M8P2_9TELE